MSEPVISSLQHLECLSRIFPVKGAVVVGAGLGEGAWFEVLEQVDNNILLVEPDAGCVQHLKSVFADRSQWLIQQQVVAAGVEERAFHAMSLSSENSLLPPEQLKGIWPHIQSKQESICQTVALDELCRESSIVPNWLVLDCLPALPMLHGSERVLAETDVLIVRAVVSDSFCQTAQASQKQIDDFIQKRGFNLYGLEAEQNPTLVHVVYVRGCPRGSAKKLGELKQKVQEQDIALEKKSGTLKTLEREKKTLEGQLKTQNKENDGKQKELLELTQKCGVQEQELGQVRRQVEKLQNERDQAELRSEKLEQERRSLEEKIEEDNHRMQQFQQELARAEWQIVMIKDLLLREEEI